MSGLFSKPKVRFRNGVKLPELTNQPKLHYNHVHFFFLSPCSTSLSPLLTLSLPPARSLPLFVCFGAVGCGREFWVFVLFYWELHRFLTTVWKQARMPHDSMIQPCCSSFLSLRAHTNTHTRLQPTYKQNSHDANLQTARTACQPLITANESTSISTPHTICIQNIPLHFCL